MPVLINQVPQAQRFVSGPALFGNSRCPSMALPRLGNSFLPSPATESIVVPSPVPSHPRAGESPSFEWRRWITHHGSAKGTLGAT